MAIAIPTGRAGTPTPAAPRSPGTVPRSRAPTMKSGTARPRERPTQRSCCRSSPSDLRWRTTKAASDATRPAMTRITPTMPATATAEPPARASGLSIGVAAPSRTSEESRPRPTRAVSRAPPQQEQATTDATRVGRRASAGANALERQSQGGQPPPVATILPRSQREVSPGSRREPRRRTRTSGHR